MEFMVRGKGYIHSPEDIENIVVRADSRTGTPLLVRDLARAVRAVGTERAASRDTTYGQT